MMLLKDKLLQQELKFHEFLVQLDSNIQDPSSCHESEPPERTVFTSLEEAKAHLKDYMRRERMGLVISDSRKDSYTVYRCDRGGQYRNRRRTESWQRVRKLRTRKCGCEFKLILKKESEHFWHLELQNSWHNHGQNSSLESIPILRRRDLAVKEDIRLLLQNGVTRPSDIHSFLEAKYQDIIITKRDIYNEIGAASVDTRTGSSCV